LGRAQRDVREAPRGDVPTHLRDAHYRSAATIGHGQGYEYPHDHPDAYVDQEYRPAAVAGTRYYEPSDRGHEAVVAERLRRLRGGDAADAADVPQEPPADASGSTGPTGPTGVAGSEAEA
jgi:putative ATPase